MTIYILRIGVASQSLQKGPNFSILSFPTSSFSFPIHQDTIEEFIMRQASYLTIFFLLTIALFKNVYAAPTSAIAIQKREGNLLHAFGLGLVAVKDGVLGTLDGIQHPEKGSGSRKDIEQSATTAGNNVGSGLGTALKNGAI